MNRPSNLKMLRFIALVAVFAFLALSPAVGASPAGRSSKFPARIDLAVYVTDSGFPQLVVIPLGAHSSLPPPSAATFLPVGGDMLQAPGINLNGIVAKSGVLLVANSTTGKLFQVDPATGVADKLDLGGADLSYRMGSSCSGTSSTWSAPSTTGSP